MGKKVGLPDFDSESGGGGGWKAARVVNSRQDISTWLDRKKQQPKRNSVLNKEEEFF
jgi:hypothetical protein